MKCFYKLSCNLLDDIQRETLNYLTNYTDLLIENSGQLWNKVHTIDYVKSCPSLVKYCNSLNLKIKEVAFTFVWETTNVELHIDELPVTAKINFPILNTDNSINLWYKIPDELFQQYTPVVNSFNQKYYSFNNIDLTKCQLLDETKLDQPIIFNSQIPHTVKILDDSKFPRIVMPIMFFNEPISYLN